MTARRTVPRSPYAQVGDAYRHVMFYVYVLTDDTGSWPLLTFQTLPWQGLRTPPLTLLPLGEFELLDDALACAADFGAATRSRLVEEAAELTSTALGPDRRFPFRCRSRQPPA
jgi:hypothetical protein